MSDTANENQELDKQKAKSANFKRLVKPRTTNVLRALNTLGHLANRTNYNYTEEEATKVVTALEKKLEEVKNKFLAPLTDKETIEFSLD